MLIIGLAFVYNFNQNFELHILLNNFTNPRVTGFLFQVLGIPRLKEKSKALFMRKESLGPNELFSKKQEELVNQSSPPSLHSPIMNTRRIFYQQNKLQTILKCYVICFFLFVCSKCALRVAETQSKLIYTEATHRMLSCRQHALSQIESKRTHVAQH